MAPTPREALRGAMRRPRYEVIPLPGTVEAVVAHVPRSIPVTVTASPRKGLGATLDASRALVEQGYEVVPHIAARQVASEREVKEIIARLDGLGVREVFVVGGDVAHPAGPFHDGLSLLEVMADVGHPFTEVGIPGYPESHPLIHDDVLVQAMWDKRMYATYIVSQVCFAVGPILSWIARLRRRGVDLPLHVGLPGTAEKRRLLRIARRIGVGESGRFLRRHKSWLWRLSLPGAYSPRRLLRDLSTPLADPALGVAGFHIFTFNELAATEAWRQRTLSRLDGPDDGRGPG
jgi:methylenetetrahydrofolate reductase (NADPH)